MNSDRIMGMVESKLSLNWIRVAQVGWILITLFFLTTFLLGIPHRHNQLATPCDASNCPSLVMSSADATLIESTFFSMQGYATFHIGLELITAVIMSTMASLLFWKYFDNVMGILTAYLLMYMGLAIFVNSGAVFATQYPSVGSINRLLVGLFPPLVLLLIFIFPNGRFLNNVTLSLFVVFFSIFILFNIIPAILNGGPFVDPSNSTGTAIFLGMSTIGVLSQIYRYRNFSNPIEKQQMKWVLLGFVSLILNIGAYGLFIEFLPPSTPRGLLLVNTLGMAIIIFIACIFPMSMLIAILRYRLWNIDIIINRTLVYGGLTLMITAVYILLVGGIGTLAANQSGRLIGFILATIIVAFRVHPLRRSLQTAVNRIAPITAPPDNIEHKNEQRVKIPPRPASRWLAVSLLLITLIGPLAIGLLTWAGCDPFAINDGDTRTPLGLISGLAFAIVGSLIFVYRPHNRIGWLCLWISFSLPMSNALDLYVTCGVSEIISAPGMSYVAWFNYSYGVMALVPMMFFLPMVYPTGRFLSPRWRQTAVVALIVYALIGTAVGLVPDFGQGNVFYRYPLTNPFGLQRLPDWWFPLFYALFHFGFVAFNLAGAAAMVVRFRRSVGDERLQMKWLAYFLTTALGTQMLFFNLPGAFFYPEVFETIWFDIILSMVFLGFPLVIGIAIFKYRLYTIDEVINRTLVYGGLTLTVVLIYALVVGGLGLLFQDSGNLLISLVATGLIAAVFQPVRERLQGAINRLMFGQRDDPYAVLSRLSQQLQTTAVPNETLTTIVQTIATTLKLPYVAIELTEQADQIGQAFVGTPVGQSAERPLQYQNETVGRLIVSPRAANESFTPQEQQLLDNIAAQTAPVASATRLTMALQRSRERLVLTREEERRRIRRDLHDGFGPTMATLTLRLDTVVELLLADNPQAALKHVQHLKTQTQHLIGDIRRLVYELYPSVLDELGLLESLRIHVAQMRGVQGLTISIDASPSHLPKLPAAIEVAAYRIVVEAITNVIRHAQATRCVARLKADNGRLTLTITDDGVGLPATFQRGVGLASMHERAEELGGRCEIASPDEGGTQITAVLPYAAGELT